ncbi:leucine--tRNA ligase, cytoplasmic-like isoform X2 [Tripterygium wilfordii]|uniref:leucine--tRNA ligase, cytoplasmic-like isoform X2 n=1 Tax=Tripterygium wilfordii TaxID=458696 RepID=UPI0018F80CED|nr:leucine--tRNA ligase, cytoplasmic-like isoform X2 [Tripterygium wilfordii]XP_038692421.1 leucine--tRNA ligase, cytoplasmic-like isoform X2 [Tripterygium wilfordii]XP_038692437.1 leucine--tRNA ligase, cytoplasmic-like isoform X2 [Tripterygium wilfordii]
MAVMAAKRAITIARRHRLLHIESKVRSWWEEKSSHTAYMNTLTEISTMRSWPFKTGSKPYPSPGEAIRVYSADATLYTIAKANISADRVLVPNVRVTLSSIVTRLIKEIEWMEEFLAEDQPSMRTGSLSCFADRAFDNMINRIISRGDPTKPCFRFLQDCRDLYGFACGGTAGGMNRDLLLHYMNVQTILAERFCPHYADYVWREVLKKDGCVIDAPWPTGSLPDLNIYEASKYLCKVIMRIFKHKNITRNQKRSISSCLIYVKELKHQERQKLLRRFQKFCKDKQTFPMATPSWERGVVEENMDLIKTLCVLEDLQVLSVTELDDFAKADPLFSQLYEKPPSPGSIIFLARW